jgi:guanylate kinase
LSDDLTILPSRRHLFIIGAPSGAGKTSLVRALISEQPDLEMSISHTTRPKRSGEIDGIDYNFVDTQEFNRLKREHAFLEHAKVFDNQYGTSYASIKEIWSKEKDALLEIDWQGARKVRKSSSGCVSIFIFPPSLKALEDRLKGRGDSEEDIRRRMQGAQSEMSHYKEFDYLIVNENFQECLQKIKNIIEVEQLTLESQIVNEHKLIKELIAE